METERTVLGERKGRRQVVRSPSLEACVQDWMVAWGICCSWGWGGRTVPFPLTVCHQHTKGGLAVLTRKQRCGTMGAMVRTTFSQPLGGSDALGLWASSRPAGGSGVWLMVETQRGPIRRVLRALVRRGREGRVKAGDRSILPFI